MRILIVTDIFGLCESTDELASSLRNDGHKVNFIDPYQGKRYSFNHEADAYKTFVDHCGHDAYFLLAQNVFTSVTFDTVIGFSAGANVVWRLSSLNSAMTRKMICFYPTRIHNYLHLSPNIMTDVIFPKQEPSFDVSVIAQKLALLENVSCRVTTYQHGFMNNRSLAYSQEGTVFGTEFIKGNLK